MVRPGATWQWSKQPEVAGLAARLGIQSFRRGRAVAGDEPGVAPSLFDLVPPFPTELRFAGGAQDLCRRPAARLPEGAVVPGTEVTSMSVDGDEADATAPARMMSP